jgi:hypothetical protein
MGQVSDVRLVGWSKLIEMILKMKQGTRMQSVAATQPVGPQQPVQEQKTGQKCGAAMIWRKSSMGYFLGCQNLPKCRSTQAL